MVLHSDRDTAAEGALQRARSNAVAGLADGRRAAWSPRFNSTRVLMDLFIVAETLLLYLAGVAISTAYVGGVLEATDFHARYQVVMAALLLTLILFAKGRKLYEFESLYAFSKTIGRMIGCVLSSFALMAFAGFALGVGDDYSRVWIGLWLTSSLVIVVVLRAGASSILRRGARAGVIRLNTVVYGEAATAARLASEIARARPELNLMEVFATGGAEGIDRGPSLHRLVAFGQANEIDLVIVTVDTLDQRGLTGVLSALNVLPAEVQVHLDFGGDTVPVRGLSSCGGLHFLDVQRRPISDWNILVKAAEDYTIAVVALVLLSPLFVLIALAIRLESAGPVIFRQQRHGFNQKVFTVRKFRTMTVMEDGAAFRQATRHDRRVTRVGRFLRSTSLDELPQLLNVLRGEMSIVGPRPHPLAMSGQYPEILRSYATRHKVKPGMTGWAQINGFRGPTDDPVLMEKRVEHDLEYIEKWSVWMDLKIITATPFVALVHENAF